MRKLSLGNYMCFQSLNQLSNSQKFRKKFGFEPSVSIVLDGNAEKRFETLAKMHQFKRVKWALLNNQFVNTSKRVLLHNRFAKLFREK